MSRNRYRLLMCLLALGLAVGGALWMRGHLRLGPGLLERAAREMTAEERERYVERLAEQTGGLYDVLPEPTVARRLQPRIRKQHVGAEVVSNNAGMRADTDYVGKRAGVTRIVCLGDSFVFGTGGPVTDRWADQLAALLQGGGLLPSGLEVEVYCLGIGGWTALNEATYLSSRLTAYDPDLVLALLTSNDISDSLGVTGFGQATTAFSPEERGLGSGAFFAEASSAFADGATNALAWGFCPESELRWERTFMALARLEALLDAAGARLLLSALGTNRLFVELCRTWCQAEGIRAPFLVMDYFGERLPHDGHPSRKGHEILAVHYLHALAELAWLPLNRAALPPLHEGLSLSTSEVPSAVRLARFQAAVWGKYAEELDFAHLDPASLLAFLGGLYPKQRESPFASCPDASLRAGFLLRRRPQARRLQVELDVPPRSELYPLEIKLILDGESSTTLALDGPAEAGPQVLVLELPSQERPVVQVVLEASRYYCEIEDPTMRSFTLLRAQQLP